MSTRRRSRRVPPNLGASMASTPPAGGADDGHDPGLAAETSTAADVRLGSRSANRAAKRASGVRPKTMARGGRPGGGPPKRSNTRLIALAGVALAVVAAVIIFGKPFGSPAASASPSAAATTSTVVGDGTCPTAQPNPLPAGEIRTVTISTPKGNIVIAVTASLAPIAAGNFVALVTCHFYDGSVFHRTPALQDGTPFVIQGGAAKPGTASIPYAIKDEPVTTPYKRGTVAMARTSALNSQTSQFFIVLEDASAPPLTAANTYAIFGSVISGMDIADAIYQASGGAELPTSPIPMTSVTVSGPPAATASPGPSSASSPTSTTAPSTSTAPSQSTAP